MHFHFMKKVRLCPAVPDARIQQSAAYPDENGNLTHGGKQQVRTWLETAGAGHIFITSALTGDGLDDLFACLNAEEYQ